MSRQNKQAKKMQIKKQVMAAHKEGRKMSQTEKVASKDKGKRVVAVLKDGTRRRVGLAELYKLNR